MSHKIHKFILIFAILTLVIGLNFVALKIKAQDNFNKSEEIEEDEEEVSLPEQSPQIPEDIKNTIPDQDFIDSFCYSLKWRSVEMYNTFDAAQKIFEQTKNKAAEIGIIISLPNISELRNETNQKINAVCTATTIDGALTALKDFMDFAQNKVKATFQSMSQSISQAMQRKREELSKKIENQIKERQSSEIKSQVKEKIEKEQDKLQQEITQMIQEGKISSEDASKLMQQKIQEKTEELIKQATSTIAEIDKEALEKSPEFKKFIEIGEFFKNIGKEFHQAKKMKNSQVKKFKHLALEKRKELTFKIIDKKIDEIIEKLKNSKDDIEEARKINSQIPSADDLISELKKDVEDLKTKLSDAIEKGDETSFEKLMNNFKDKWENKRKEIQQKQNAKSVCVFTIDKVKKARLQIEKALNQLIEAETKCQKREDVEQCNKFNKHLDLVNKFKDKLNQILSSIQEAENLCKVADINTSPGQIIKVLNNLKKQGFEAENLKEEFNNLIK